MMTQLQMPSSESVVAMATLLMLLLPVQTVDAVVCHECISPTKLTCSLPVAPGDVAVCNGSSCITFEGTANGMPLTARQCLNVSLPISGGCQNGNVALDGIEVSGRVCSCDTDYCNSQFLDPASVISTTPRVNAADDNLRARSSVAIVLLAFSAARLIRLL